MMRSSVVLPQPEGPRKQHQLALADREIDRCSATKLAEGLVNPLDAQARRCALAVLARSSRHSTQGEP